jgi:hypothetical protein
MLWRMAKPCKNYSEEAEFEPKLEQSNRRKRDVKPYGIERRKRKEARTDSKQSAQDTDKI